MNITSILITIVGLIFIIALYLMSRITKSKLPKTYTTLLPDIKDEKGNKFTSVLDDIPASDGYSPKIKPDNAKNDSETTDPQPKNKQDQIVLFISAKEQAGLDGNLVLKALGENGLTFGDKDIYHYLVKTPSTQNKASLFRIANGVEPWTLTENDLNNKKIAGLSIVMFIPTMINDKDARKILLSTVEKLSEDVKGILKNQQQEILSQKDIESLAS